MAFLRTPSSVRRIFLLFILWATEGPLSPWATPLTLLTQTTFIRVPRILKLVVRSSPSRTPLILLFIQLVLARAAVLVTVKGIFSTPVRARVSRAPLILEGFSSRMPDPRSLILVFPLSRTCPQRPQMEIVSICPVLLRLTIHRLSLPPTLVGARTPTLRLLIVRTWAWSVLWFGWLPVLGRLGRLESRLRYRLTYLS